MDIKLLTESAFNDLPLVVEGESKEVRYADDGLAVIRLKPTIYSYTHNRSGVIEGSESLRLQAIQALLPVLGRAGIKHTYQAVSDKWIASRLVLQPETKDNPHPFRPDDLDGQAMAALPVAPPVEVIVKAVHSGTPKHRYDRLDQYRTRNSHPTSPDTEITADRPYPERFVRFDWRNPITNQAGDRLADETLPEAMADWFINTTAAQETALKAFDALASHLATKSLVLWDICFFISEDGQTMFGEVSPDCMRVRAQDGSSLDKDIWRAGGSSENVLEKWRAFVDMLREDSNE